MLLNYKTNNFCSFYDELEFSMKPGRYMERFEDNIRNIDNKLKVSRVSVIAGENTGGKTSFFRSLSFLKFCILESKSMRTLDKLSHKYNTDKKQEFEISILTENKDIYTYYLEIDKFSLITESLSIRKYNQPVSKNNFIFKAKRKNICYKEKKLEVDTSINAHYIDSKYENILLENLDTKSGSVVNHLYKLNIPIIEPFIKWIDEKLLVEIPGDANLNMYKSMEINEYDLDIMIKDSFLEIVQLIDSTIENIIIDENEPYDDTYIIRKDSNNNEFKIRLKHESSGMRSFFAWSVQLWKVIHEDAILFADEIDSVLNPILSSKVLSYVKGTEHNGQFIFSTHNVMHLNTKDFMKEQIYFVTKNSETLSSELYSLKEFKEYRYETSNVYDLYFKGLLGGCPK